MSMTKKINKLNLYKDIEKCCNSNAFSGKQGFKTISSIQQSYQRYLTQASQKGYLKVQLNFKKKQNIGRPLSPRDGRKLLQENSCVSHINYISIIHF